MKLAANQFRFRKWLWEISAVLMAKHSCNGFLRGNGSTVMLLGVGIKKM